MSELDWPRASMSSQAGIVSGKSTMSALRDGGVPLTATICPRPSEFSIGIGALEAFLTGPRAVGLDVDNLCRASGLPDEFCRNPKARLRVDQWGRILQNIMTAMDDEALGLLGRSTPVGTFLMVCRALIHCRTVGEAMKRYVEFYNILRIGILYNYVESENTIALELKLSEPDVVKNPIIVEFTLVAFHRLFSWLTSEYIDLDYVRIVSDSSMIGREYREVFGNSPIYFNQEVYSISFNNSFMNLPITRTERELESFLEKFNSALFLPMPREGQLSRTLRTFMLDEQQRKGIMPELQDAASHFGMQPSALRRHLKDVGLSFQALKSRVRRDIAIYYLSHTCASIERIAEYVGFSETSAFTRAFRDWTSMTPFAFRKTMSN